jgi:polysaccharide export outer membrane protein
MELMTMKLPRLVARLVSAIVVAGLLAACSAATSGTGGTGVVKTTQTLPAPEILAAIPNAAEAEHRVGPSDVLEISVFQVEALSKTVQVSASGQIALPLIGVVQAAGKTVAELEQEIATKLGEKYIQSPQVSVYVKEAMSQRVTVEGAVKNPGMVSLTGPTSLLQTIALSGGLTEFADPKGIVVFRTVQQQKMAARFNLSDIRAGKAQDPTLAGGDIVVVDQGGFRAAFRGLRQSIPVAGFFVPFLL